MTKDSDFITTNDQIINEKIAEIDYELQAANITNFLQDLDEFINLLATYQGDEENITYFIEELTSKLARKSNLNHYDLFLYHTCVKLAEFYSISKNDYLNAIQRLIVAIRSYSIAYDLDKNIQIFIDILKLKIYALLQDDIDFRNQLIQEVDELFIQFLDKIRKKDVNINGVKVKKQNFFEVKSNILEFSLILFLINQNNGSDEIYKRLEEIFIFFREQGFDVYILGKALGTLILKYTPEDELC
ncbi:MAG: hypothetical protein ACTSPY_15920 [Candidatus Helarchaeota archaeon]